MDPCDRCVEIRLQDDVRRADRDRNYLSVDCELPLRLLKFLLTLRQCAQLSLESLLSHALRLSALGANHA
jgi:hypothetical protein